MKVLLTGACGYKGSVLVPKLLKAGHRVVAFDIMWFGNFLEPHPDLTVVQGDVRNPGEIDLTAIDAIIHLSSVANDPCWRSRPQTDLGNQIASRPCSSPSRPGATASSASSTHRPAASMASRTTRNMSPEDLELLPISEYNKTKMCGERIVMSYKRTTWWCRSCGPRLCCGYSPRQRLDVSVNMLTMQALMNGRITVFGGDQTRPNIHIE